MAHEPSDELATPGAGPPAVPDVAAIEAWLRKTIAGVLALDVREVNVHQPIAHYGVDSSEVVGMIADLEVWLDRELPLDLVWEWATTREVAQRIADHVAGGDGPDGSFLDVGETLVRP
jgi:acyl carrier protein